MRYKMYMLVSTFIASLICTSSFAQSDSDSVIRLSRVQQDAIKTKNNIKEVVSLADEALRILQKKQSECQSKGQRKGILSNAEANLCWIVYDNIYQLSGLMSLQAARYTALSGQIKEARKIYTAILSTYTKDDNILKQARDEMALLKDGEKQKTLQVSKKDVTKEFKLIGKWRDNTPYIGSSIEFYRQGKDYFLEYTFDDGSTHLRQLNKDKLNDGQLIYRRLTHPNEYMFIAKDNNMQFWDNEGLIYEATPIP